MEELSGLTAWMLGNARDSEWAEYYRYLSDDFGVQIDTSGPVFGRDHIMEKIGASKDLITFAARTQFAGYPDIAHIPVTDPTPVCPWSLMWHGLNRHPALPLLIAHVKARYRPYDARSQWLPAPDRSLFPADPNQAPSLPSPGILPLPSMTMTSREISGAGDGQCPAGA
jgi:hypothetical protein